MTQKIPILAITMGDPAGIGPEILVKALGMKSIYKLCKPVVVGHVPVIEKTMKLCGASKIIRNINRIEDAVFTENNLNVFEIGGQGAEKISYGEISEIAGDLAFRSIKKAIELAQKGIVDGTVTGPIHKESLNKAGHHFSGHTEIYAHFTNTKKYAMLLADEHFRIIHVTTHVSLREACDLIKTDKILDTILLLNAGLYKMGFKKPRIGVAGLNPHSSDGGLFGKEDNDEILPAVKLAKEKGIMADGPVPADTLFAMAYGGKYDGCVAMYHDQGHIPFKLMGFKWDEKQKIMKSVTGVNITLGLPILRTSVDHGTAFEIAGKGIASPDALVHAIEYANLFLS